MSGRSLSGLPDPKKEYVLSFPGLSGGLNLWELDYRLKADESPEMVNLAWREGALNCRDGQVWANADDDRGAGHRAYGRLFHGFIVAHAGTALWSFDTENDCEAAELLSNVGETPGSFFLYGEKLYYKTKGTYAEISYTDGGLSADAVTPYVPVTVVNAAPENGAGELYQPENRLSAAKTVWYNAVDGVTAYHLPVQGIDSVDRVVVDGAEKTPGSDYTVDLAAGVVSFASAPPVTTPPTNNSVSITYSKADDDAENSIMDCTVAAAYGGTGRLCIVMGGSEKQPNAYFWNGGSSTAMEPGYFPMNQYQLAGDGDNAVTGFGAQQSYLIIFQKNAVGRSALGVVSIDGRDTLELPYTAINDAVGCDLPDTVRLVGNNLVWCSRDQGVHILKDSSSALENNVECLSRKINGSSAVPGLLEDVRSADAAALNDGSRYWLCANGHVWVWDYELSKSSDPAWFYWTDIDAAALIREKDRVWHINSRGQLTAFARVYADYSGPIHKVYRFATQHFGSFERLKNVDSVIITARSDTNAVQKLTYITDFEQREERTPLSSVNWLLTPRNLRFRSLRGRGFAEVFRRRPLCRRVRHFTMRLENDEPGQDLSVVSAQIFYNFQGRQR